MTIFRGHILYILIALLPIVLILTLSIETAPDRAQYRYYFANPENAIRLEPGFTIILRIFESAYIPPNVSISIVILFVISTYLQAGFRIIGAKSSNLVLAILIFIFSVYVTPSFIQIRFGLAIGLVVLGYANFERSRLYSILLILVGCTLHYSVMFFAICFFAAIVLDRIVKKKYLRFTALLGFVVLPSALYELIFSQALLSNYYQSYFEVDYNNVVYSLSSFIFITLIVTFAFLQNRVDASSYLVAGGLGVLCLVFYSGFAVFHRLYFPTTLICFFHVLDGFSSRIGSRRAQIYLTLVPLILFPFSIYFTCIRLGMVW